jgi:hypothetical protein
MVRLVVLYGRFTVRSFCGVKDSEAKFALANPNNFQFIQLDCGGETHVRSSF